MGIGVRAVVGGLIRDVRTIMTCISKRSEKFNGENDFAQVVAKLVVEF